MPQPEKIGRYRVLRRIGGGGMGELYLGVSSGLEGFQKRVAIKRLRPGMSEDADYVGMFLQEARIAATLEHPNIVNVTEVDRDGEDYFLVMSYLEGCSLDRVIRVCKKEGKPGPSVAFSVTIGLGIAAGLDYAHHKRDLSGQPLEIIHRDVSPHNIFVTYQGEVKLLDFGIAKAASSSVMTAANVRKGKAGYMAPEQCKGQPLDARTDIFGLGVVLYELSTLTRPFGDAVEDLVILSRTLEGTFRRPTEVIEGFPERLSEIICCAMHPKPQERFESARAMHDALLEFAREEGLDVAPRTVAQTVNHYLGPRAAEVSSAVDPALPDASALPPIPEFGTTASVQVDAEPELSARPEPTPRESSARIPKGRSSSVVTSSRAHEDLDGHAGLKPGRKWAIGVPVGLAVIVAAFYLARSGTSDPSNASETAVPTPTGSSPTMEELSPDAMPIVAPDAASAGDSASDKSAGNKFGGVEPRQLLRLVNERDFARALEYRDRHEVLDQLARHPEFHEKVDHRVQLSLDLRQASQADDPCQVFAAALASVQAKPDPFFLATLMTVQSPREGTGCEALAKQLADVTRTVEALIGG